MESNNDDLARAVYKRAVGYTSTECVEEFSMQDGQLAMTKQKVTTKEVAPDIAAAKLVMESLGGNPYDSMTDEELKEEKERLLKMLKEEDECLSHRPKKKGARSAAAAKKSLIP